MSDATPDDYLWDGSGDPDPVIARLELTLAGFRLPGEPDAPARRLMIRGPLVAAAGLIVALGLGAWLVDGPGAPGAAGRAPGGTASLQEGWNVAVLSGAPAVGDGVLRPGQSLVTGVGERVRLQVADIGRVDVEPGSTLRLVRSGIGEHRIALDRGRIDAFVIAPPRLFLVETPAALAVDLGCAYELDVEDDGSGRLRVTAGWVALQRDGRETIVPEGAICRIDRDRGPGVPRYEVSPESFDRALDRVEAGDHSAPAIAALLAESSSHDVLSLWHLVPVVADEASRRALVVGVAAREPPPDGVTLDAVVALDAAALAAWAEELATGW